MKEMTKQPQFFARVWPTCFNSGAVTFLRKCVEHRFFGYVFYLIIVANAFCIAFEYDGAEIAFLVVFNLEMFLKLFTFGTGKFFSRFWNIFDVLVIGGATIVAVIEGILDKTLAGLDVLMVLRVLRLCKIVQKYDRFKVIVNTIMQIGPAMLTYGGIIFILYYVYSIIGMEAFAGYMHELPVPNSTNRLEIFPPNCGDQRLKGSEYVRLNYCGKNFNDVLKSFNLLFDLTVVNQWHAFVLEAFMLQYTFSKTKYEAALEKKIQETGAGSEDDLSRTRPQENRLDENFSIVDYVQKARVSYKLKKRKTKNAEEILQQMFEDELNADDLGPDLQDFDELNDAIEHESDAKSRALTLNTVDADL
eukprot:gene3223-1542_t